MSFERDEGPITDLGHGVRVRLVDYGEHGVEKDIDVEYWHPCSGQRAADGELASWVPCKPGHWTLVSREPLTLSPSLLCRLCGHHGFIRDGKWVPA
jgi:hypothetical protein